MKKTKLISALSTLGVVAGTTPIVATACGSSLDNDEVVEGYSISCTTADANNKITTQPGQFEKFALSYKGVPYTYDEEPYIYWSVEVIGGDTSVNPIFIDNYIGAQGCGYLYCSYLGAGEWKPGNITKIRVTASSFEYGRVLARKTVDLTRADKTYYTPKASDLTLMNTIQLVSSEGKFQLALNEDDGSTYPEVKDVKWSIDDGFSTPAITGIVYINDKNQLVVKPGADLTTATSGYITIKANVPDYDKPLYFCTNIWVAEEGIEFEELPETELYKIPGAPYEYCNYFFIPIQNATNTKPTPVLKMKQMSTQSYDQVYWNISTKKDAVTSNTPFNFYTASGTVSRYEPEPTLKLNANSSEFKKQGYFYGIIYLYKVVDGKNVLVAQRNIVISVVDKATFEAIKNL